MQSLSLRLLRIAAGTTICGLATVAQAQVAEDSSAAFKASNEALSAARGLPAAESTVTTHANGMTSANMGLEAMKMLVVRQNADGTLSFGHAGSADEAQEFLNGESTTRLEEQQ